MSKTMRQRALDAIEAAKVKPEPKVKAPINRKDKLRPKRNPIRLEKRRFQQQKGCCYLCGDWLPIPGAVVANHDKSVTVDHVTPRSQGGLNVPENKLLAHAICNHVKGNRMPTDRELTYLANIVKMDLEKIE